MSENWLEVAKTLAVGKKTYISCCKGDEAKLLVSHSSKGYSAWCFRCHRKEFERHGDRRIADILRHKAESAFIKQQDVVLPDDYTLDVPMAQAVWYMQSGISPELARHYGIGFSPSLHRVVLPVYEGEELAAVQMRACAEEQKPKYLNVTGGKNAAMFWSDTDYEEVGVITEDILSAIKVGRVINSASILGSHLSDERVMKLARRWKQIVVWLDPDKAGRDGAQTAARKLMMQGVVVHKIVSEKDPKLHSLDEIQAYIRGAIIDRHNSTSHYEGEG